MGRRPIGKRAMTDAERQRRRRARLNALVANRIDCKSRVPIDFDGLDVLESFKLLRAHLRELFPEVKWTVKYGRGTTTDPHDWRKRKLTGQAWINITAHVPAVSYPAPHVKRLKAAMVAAHPDRGGSNEAFHKAHKAYAAAKGSKR
jgi:hypothetical protein